ncbi:MAG: hypothetical protein H2049_08010 [Porphyrobacter sp.]|nr:hypothetical protein [Porphyrobacter sp.]
MGSGFLPIAASLGMRHHAVMKALLAVLALGTGAPTLAQTSEQTAVMQAIEAAVLLPEGAGELAEYSRNYAAGPDGKVLAFYVIPFETLITDEDVGCEVMLEDLESRPCTDEEVAEMVRDDLARAERMGKAGQSRWFDSYGELPLVLDGGCNFIEIIYDPKTKRIERAECNGYA